MPSVNKPSAVPIVWICAFAVFSSVFSADALASFINYSSKEINIKIVYYGPPSASLHGNLAYIYSKTSAESKGKLIDIKTADDENIEFFDFLPLSLGEIRGFKVRFHLYTAPGKAKAEGGRLLILKGVDGVVFVADCDPAAIDKTVASWKGMLKNLDQHGYDAKTTPIVLQLEHTTEANALSADTLRKRLGAGDRQMFVADVASGVGVFDSLKAIAKLVLYALKKGAE